MRLENLNLVEFGNGKLGSISPTCLRAAFTTVAPKSIRIQSSCLYLFTLWDIRAQKLHVKCWWNWHLVLGLRQIWYFSSYLKNGTSFKGGQKWLENNHRWSKSLYELCCIPTQTQGTNFALILKEHSALHYSILCTLLKLMQYLIL